MVQTAVQRLTLAEYLDLPVGDGPRELEQGVVVDLSQVQGLHGDLVLNLTNVLNFHIENQGLLYKAQAQVYGIPIPQSHRPHTSRTPDICVVTLEQAAKLERQRALLDSPPLLVVEVVSEGAKNYQRDPVDKLAEYARAQVPEYWTMDYTVLGKELVSVYCLEQLPSGWAYAEENAGKFGLNEAIVSPTFPHLRVTLRQLLSKLSGRELLQF